jgi:uncharacterized protein YdeI (YjbR/CyaY-like superfamily)
MSEQPVIAFVSAAKFRQWLTKHHAAHPGIWMQIAKKARGIASITYAEAFIISMARRNPKLGSAGWSGLSR